MADEFEVYFENAREVDLAYVIERSGVCVGCDLFGNWFCYKLDTEEYVCVYEGNEDDYLGVYE